MAEEGDEQNKTEDASQFKLERARKKGNVARGADLGFLAILVALAMAAQMFGAEIVHESAQVMREAFTLGIASAAEPRGATSLAGDLAQRMVGPVVTVGVIAIVIVILVDIVQLRGFIFSSQPLKPDFARMNPAKGLKRIFSLRTLKETGKSIAKMAAYAGVTFLLVQSIVGEDALRASSGQQLAALLVESAGDILLLFIALAVGFAAIDQIIVRREFAKQMRMSRREQTKEHREREGEPRQKQKRKQLHADFIRQNAAVNSLPGSDILIVNPEHYAVALIYKPESMEAPQVKAKGRNAFALRMRRNARRLGIVVIENAPLARALFKKTRVGAEIPVAHFAAVADMYIMLRRQQRFQGSD